MFQIEIVKEALVFNLNARFDHPSFTDHDFSYLLRKEWIAAEKAERELLNSPYPISSIFRSPAISYNVVPPSRNRASILPSPIFEVKQWREESGKKTVSYRVQVPTDHGGIHVNVEPVPPFYLKDGTSERGIPCHELRMSTVQSVFVSTNGDIYIHDGRFLFNHSEFINTYLEMLVTLAPPDALNDTSR